MPTPDWQLKLLFDGECPLCAREIAFLRRRDRHGRIAFEDIASHDFDPAHHGLDRQRVMARIHGVLPDGTVVEGMEVFRRAYSAVGLGFLVAPSAWPGLRVLFDAGYRVFARNRLRWTGRAAAACHASHCAADPPLHTLEVRTELPLPPSRVFAFFADAANLERITPPELRFRIETPLPIAMCEGARIEYRLSLYGVPFAWHTRIARWEPETCFVDEQLRGPYRLWVHTHRFEPSTDGTIMHDVVRWSLPLQPLGELAAPLVRRQLERIFRYRERALREALLNEPTPAAPGVTSER